MEKNENHKNPRIQFENQENQENTNIPFANNENHENHRNQCEKHEIMKITEFHVRITIFNKNLRIPTENYENHENLRIS